MTSNRHARGLARRLNVRCSAAHSRAWRLSLLAGGLLGCALAFAPTAFAASTPTVNLGQAAGYAVICISRGLKEPYRQDPAWKLIQRVEMDRVVEEQAGRPRYSSLAALRESVNWLIYQSVVHAGR